MNISFSINCPLGNPPLPSSTMTNLDPFRMDDYHIQLRTLFDYIEKLLPIENELEQKLITSIDYPVGEYS